MSAAHTPGKRMPPVRERPDAENQRAHVALRLFAGAMAIMLFAGGAAALILDFPSGILAGVLQAAIGVAAAYYAWRGKDPTWFRS